MGYTSVQKIPLRKDGVQRQVSDTRCTLDFLNRTLKLVSLMDIRKSHLQQTPHRQSL